MPWMMLIVSLLLSMGVFLSSHRLLGHVAESRVLTQSEAAFLAAESRGEGELVLNQDVEIEELARDTVVDRKAFQQQWYGVSGEISLLEVALDQAVQSVEVEYCQAGEACPEVVVEWFLVSSGYRFQRLSDIEPSDFEVEFGEPCLKIPRTSVERCVRLSKQGDFGPLAFTGEGFRLETNFPAYGYLLRFWSLDQEELRYRVRAFRGAEEVALPHQVEELDVMAASGGSVRRIRQQEWVSAGLQDGLNFAHYSQELENK